MQFQRNAALIPIPPSANAMWVHARRGVFRSDEYNSWCELASQYARKQLDQFPAPVKLVFIIRGGAGWRANRDIDNIIKVTTDMLVAAGRIPGDTCDIVRHTSTEFLLKPEKPKRKRGEPKPKTPAALMLIKILPYIEPDEEALHEFENQVVRLQTMSHM